MVWLTAQRRWEDLGAALPKIVALENAVREEVLGFLFPGYSCGEDESTTDTSCQREAVPFYDVNRPH